MDCNKEIAERIRKVYGGNATHLSAETIGFLAEEFGVRRERVATIESELTYATGDGSRRIRSEYKRFDPPGLSAVD